ncbi:hypothetical protein [Nocardioides speluncae]|uniref:hypothetical protein n=1 Tax=Nocardioides speluncae TaxID=2670337 RepID=UPI000D69DCD4|nr:hypothetical protein [Nocardioides speluncae]
MEIERVQKWVMTALLLTVAAVFAGGLCVLAGTVDNSGGAKPGLLVIAALVGLFAMVGARVIHGASVASVWLLLGLLPAAIGWYFLYA